jgi:hypothetical protein
MQEKKKLTDILRNGDRESLRKSWDQTRAAADFTPLPSGEYVAHVIAGDLFTSKGNTPGFKITFQVIEGEHANRRFWHDVWLTPAALPMAKRDLGKLGISDLDQLNQPMPRGIRCKVKLALRREDGGTEHNRVVRFAVLGFDPPTADPFAPPAANGEGVQP